ncbi:MAG: copper chaperone PCu(A)C [Parvibaculum sp.]|uniref:copper chaperone PCu(A)C n=1 Tax=Parvibaculum sp. TaxID=2024848 RepID=UPI002AB86D64|nr:copper chaperone PCu(A)C [Parvibaculum sp.]MDZ4381168.1 copper chaperone PCu(A)C [Parvibaculum sp.]
MFRPLLPVLLMLAPLLASCGDNAPSEIAVSEVWARASVTNTGAAYAAIENKGGADDRLVEAMSPVAERVEIHDMTMDGMVMKMRRLDALPVKAGETVTLAPGGKHIMLIGLYGPLEEGASVPLTLVFEKAGRIELSAPVRPAGGTGR